MSLHYRLLVELDLRSDLTDNDLVVVRWLLGGEAPPHVPDGLEPLVLDSRHRETSVPSLDLPGGTTASLRQRLMPSATSRPIICWSLAVRTLVVDDAMYETGLSTLAWLGHRAHEDGFLALAREELDPTHCWTFITSAGWTYLISDGQPSPLESEAPALSG